MKIITTLVIFSMTVFLFGCSKGNQINGRSLKSANRSVSYIKDRLPTDQRIEFEVSYWSLRDAYRDKSEFLDVVDGKTPEELTVLGKEIFQERRNAGFDKYLQYNNWDQMITQFAQERIDQNRHLKQEKRNGSLMYKL